MVKPRRGGPAQLVDEVAALFGALSLRPVVLRPRFPEGKGQDERMIGYLQTSFLPLRRYSSIEDFQCQHDTWARTVAFERRPRRLAGRRGVAGRARLSRFVRFGDVDYSVPPGLAGRRVQLAASLREVVVFLDGDELARHARSYVRADVVLDPTHGRALRLERAARRRLQAKDVAVPPANLTRYDIAVGITP